MMLLPTRGNCVVVRTKNPGDQPMSATNDYLPNGTPVLNTDDGETGTIINGFAFDPEAGCTEYEVATQNGIERWQRTAMLLLDEIEIA